ncbi:hypothetical protein EVAR_24391_1 [Eumeta japonica]|uniref:Uncharacterized protein n=1 Tax=Eumeta variegata TaxID=151549 RepID=A0A4C1VS10_EUMVA|nr:hypothetical protein EVAR_24391_1 [Eumeta japonica]
MRSGAQPALRVIKGPYAGANKSRCVNMDRRTGDGRTSIRAFRGLVDTIKSIFDDLRCETEAENTMGSDPSSASSANARGLISRLPTWNLTHSEARDQDWL